MLLAVHLSRDKYTSFHSLTGRGHLIMSQEEKEIMSCHIILLTGSSFQEVESVHSLMVSVCIWDAQDKVVI